jgi:23S rRNA pseudouridine1911/1915/1917 synthase
LDQLVTAAFPELSRTQASRLIATGAVSVEGRAVSAASMRARKEALVEVDLPDAPPVTRLTPEDIPLTVVHQDDAIVVIDKPAGMVVHPSAGHAAGTLANAVLGLDPDGFVGLVHRLDRDTSGLLVVARSEAALRDLQEQWQRRGVEKVYLALVHGTPKEARATIEAPIGRDPRERLRMAVTTRGRAATTEYRVASRYRGASLLECRIHTGRTHQIRVHLASIGHSIVGDALYGKPEPALGRQFLHAHRLAFRHPRSAERVAFEAPLPDDLSAHLRTLESLA